MTAPRSLLLALLGSLALGVSCYSEQLPPSTYRFACDADTDCDAGEICRRGLCERPCHQATAQEDCPFEDGYATCFNGACANTCELGAGRCPGDYECIDLGLEAGGGFGGPSEPVGLCGLECDPADDDICPEGEICVDAFGLGACVVDCSAGQDCPSGYFCLFGVCAPEGTEIPMGDTSGSGGAIDPGDDSEVLR